jgi:hypothetical protein
MGFREAADQLFELVEKKQISNHKRLRFIFDAKLFLDKLNFLRNRLLHRGTYILRYKALDSLVGEHIFPFVQNALKLDIYSDSKLEWRYQKLNCEVDPMEKIAKEAKTGNYNIHRIALLKELGRAAYENPVKYGPLRKQKYGIRVIDGVEQDAKALAKAEKGKSDAVEVKVCPVCGVKALVVYGTTRAENVSDEYTGQEHILREEFYTYAVRCLCCSFEIENELKAAAFSGLRIKNYWRVEELTRD